MSAWSALRRGWSAKGLEGTEGDDDDDGGDPELGAAQPAEDAGNSRGRDGGAAAQGRGAGAGGGGAGLGEQEMWKDEQARFRFNFRATMRAKYLNNQPSAIPHTHNHYSSAH